MEVECLKCGKIKVVKSRKNCREKPSPFCKSCTAYYGNIGKSLIDEYIFKYIPNYNPSGPYTFICKCGNEQTYTTKASLFRILIGSNMCGKCSRSAKRKGWTLSPEQVKRMRETAIKNQTSYDSVEEWEKSKKKKEDYYEAVDTMSRSNLRLYKPDEYKKWKSNTYNGTNYETGLTIEHRTPKSVCYEMGLTVSQAAHINNLEVISMIDNNKSWKDWEQKRKLYEKAVGQNTYKKKYLIKEEWWNK